MFIVHKYEYKQHFNFDWVWPQKIEFLNFTFSDGILEQVGIVPMPSAKQQPSNIKHGSGIRPNVWVLTFGPPCIMPLLHLKELSLIQRASVNFQIFRKKLKTSLCLVESKSKVDPGINR